MSKTIIVIIGIALSLFLIQRAVAGKSAAAENIQKGLEFMAANQTLEGVQTTRSGLQYKVLSEGTGTVHPGPRDKVKVHYHGTLIDGTVFDSSVDRGAPISFGLNQVIPGWTEGLQLMVVGEKTRLFIPSNLAYRNRSMGVIGGGSTLVFDVELLGINE
ncbi:MAG: FKBP-type peptidyl-prolyl cis-trans isomerase [Porticoccaceae bacterium]